MAISVPLSSVSRPISSNCWSAGACVCCLRPGSPRCGCFACPTCLALLSCSACSARCCGSSRGASSVTGAWFDIAHMLAGGLVLLSLMLLYQDRMFALLNVFALHAVVLSLSVAWQAQVQHAPHLYITALIALVLKALVIPVALRRIVVRLGIHRTIETVVGIGRTMLAGRGLVGLSMGVVVESMTR